VSISRQSPIGIFDSGIGGLTVAKAVAKALPEEDIIYFGDTARVPYGIKSPETVREYALQITDFLLSKGVKMILIACNTVSASAKDEILVRTRSIPVLDVISSGTETALADSSSKHIGVIGTLATVNSSAYKHSIQEVNKDIKVTQQACPLLVPLAEEGWIDNEIATKTLESYLSVFDKTDIDSLILGCTHYPLFKHIIPKVLKSDSIRIIDSADSIALTAKQTLNELDLLNTEGGDFQCFVSDRPQRFHDLAERFLGRKLSDVIVTHL
jgi:glutamate racemase